MVQTAQDVMSFAKEHGAQMVSLRFIDFIGRWRHFTVPRHKPHEGTFEEDLNFDGSSIKGWLEIRLRPHPMEYPLDFDL
ncbi:glutamine synthetase [Cystobacter fuscus]|uniref:Glutamine synthetase n=1 Tax=Cystobacter fuscus TaxID=43 RepID=A0A250JJL5_9BACT|nr:glutamine synthetase [Cystobacter fuscus]ATB43833.1 glutamine synthetase [Cystobacter fuscus]